MQVNSFNTAPVAKDATPSSDFAPNPAQVLTQKDFLKLLVTQMQNQNPLEPQSDTEMAAQMAQFTSLQQTSGMSASLQMMQADSLLGNTVDLQIDANTATSGVVEGVIMQNGTPQIVVNGNAYQLSQVVAVIPTVTPPANPTTN